MYYHENLRKDNKDHERAEKKIKIIHKFHDYTKDYTRF